jgi:hypothetical protein
VDDDPNHDTRRPLIFRGHGRGRHTVLHDVRWNSTPRARATE